MCNLKAFYKFWESACEKRIGNCNAMEISKRTWIDAMKEVQRQIKLGNSVAYAGDDVLMAIEKFIDEELGELK